MADVWRQPPDLTGGILGGLVTDGAKVDAVSQPYLRMFERWLMIEDLLGGTPSMRMAGSRWLPREEEEDPRAWEVRLSRSYLYPATRDTLAKITAKPFSVDVNVQGDLPEPLVEIEGDCDLQGTNLTQFARELFWHGVGKGHSHVFVDHPDVPSRRPDGQRRTMRDERLGKIRPYFTLVTAEDVPGFRMMRTAAGTKVLTQVRTHEIRAEADGAWGEKEVHYIRVWSSPDLGRLDAKPLQGGEPGSWQLWRKEDGDKAEDYVLVPDAGGSHNYPGVPLSTFYAEKIGFMESRPPLEDLAWLNLAHWQSMSDQRNLLRYARAPILAVYGFIDSGDDDEGSDKIVVGPLNALKFRDPGSKAEFVEHSGKAISAGAEDLAHLEEQMTVLGLQPFVRKTGNITATGRAIDESRSQSSIHQWIAGCEACIEDAYAHAAAWVGVELPEDFRVDIFSDFGISLRAAEDIQALIDARRAGEISRKTFLSELKKRALLDADLDVDEEIRMLEQETESLVGQPQPFETDGDGRVEGEEGADEEESEEEAA